MLPSAEVTLDGRRIRYTLRRSPRARWISGWIRPETGLVVTLPRRATARQAEAFLIAHRRWVIRHVERVASRAGSLPRPWPYGPQLLYRGRPHAVLVRRSRVAGVGRTPDRRLFVGTPSATLEGARRVLRRWLTAEARRVLGERVEVWGARMAQRPRRVYVRDLRATWGRCWPGGSLSFTWRLIMAPPRILDYVVVHELAHLRERGHGPRFWSLVEAHCPAHRTARAWLRDFAPVLAV